MVSLQELTGILGQALSQEQADVKHAEGQLGSFETQAGYHHALASIFRDATLSEQIRWIAIVCLKNGVDKYWRRNVAAGISADEKAAIRELLLSAATSQLNPQVALHLAIVIGKIARYDFPQEWPQLITALMSNIGSPSTYESLLALYHVIKALTTKRIMSDRSIFCEIAAQMHEPITQYWKSTTQVFLANNADTEMLQRSLISLKILKLLFVHGGKVSIEPRMASCFEDIFNWLLAMLHLRAQYQQAEGLATKLTKWCLQCTKILIEVQEKHTVTFKPFVKGSLSLAVQFAFNADWRKLMFERCLVNVFNLLRSCINEKFYWGDLEEYKTVTNDTTDVISDFFKTDTIREFILRLIFEFFIDTDEDIEKCRESPEEFAVDVGGDLWKYSLRPCAENLFMSMYSVFKGPVDKIVRDLIQEAAEQPLISSVDCVRRRESIYTTVGLSVSNLIDDIDFDSWFHGVALVDLRNKNDNHVMLHRSILNMITQWSEYFQKESTKSVIYGELVANMEPNNALIIRLTACFTAKAMCNNYSFDAEGFAPFLERYLRSLYQLLSDVEECESKIVVLQLTTFIMERMGEQCYDFIGEICGLLPALWLQSAEHNMFRAAIIGIVSRCVYTMGSQSVGLYPMTLEIIAHSVDRGEPEHIFLMEEALELWRRVVEESPSPDPELLKLSRFIPPILELGSEHLEPICDVLIAYIVMYGRDYLNLYPKELCESIHDAMKELNVKGCSILLRVINTAIRVDPEEAIKVFYPVLYFALDEIVSTSYVREMTNTSFSIWCRVLIYAEPAAMQLVNDRAVKNGTSADAEMKEILDAWLKKMVNVSVVQTQKLMGITLLRLLVDNWSPMLYERVCAIALAVSMLLDEIMQTNLDGEYIDSLLMPDDVPESVNADVDLDQSQHSARLFRVLTRDLVHTVDMSKFLVNQMMALAQRIGPQFSEILQEIDCETRDTLEGYTKRGIFSDKASRSV